MEWDKIKDDGYTIVLDKRYDLGHLKDKVYDYCIEKTDRHPTLNFLTLVQYSSHCVSLGMKRNTDINYSQYSESHIIIDEKGCKRYFCKTRYNLSKHLPNIFKTFLGRHCLFTGRENWLTVEILLDNNEKVEYEVFFNLRKKSSKFLRIYVESAYIRTDNYKNNTPIHFKNHDKIKAKVLLAKKIRNEPIRRPINKKP